MEVQSSGDADRAQPAPAMQNANESLNRLIMRIAIRAEMLSDEVADKAFVEVSRFTDGLRRVDHQVVYGRRGAGKTHAFRNLATSVDRDDDLAIYIDLRTIGSSGGLYGDTSLSLTARGTQLLIDVVEAIHDQMLSRAIEDVRFEALLGSIDPLADAATDVRVEGPINLKTELSSDFSEEDDRGWTGKANLSLPTPQFTLGAKKSRKSGSRVGRKRAVEQSGNEMPRILFGRLSKAMSEAVATISPHRLWILLDEWSSLPLDMQPVLADMLRRAFFACPGVTVKIGAIERRSRFAIQGSDSVNYMGIELGADTATGINLDEHLATEEARERFFAELLFRHLIALMGTLNRAFRIEDSVQLARLMFKPGALSEFVRAAGGVPRDALQIAYHAGQQAGRHPIGVSEIQSAARKYYLQDKETGIAGNPEANRVWGKLQREVIAGRRSRTFLIKRARERTSAGILDLYDARLIHLLQSGLVASDDPSVLYDGYCLDYGSYVNILHEAELTAAWNAIGRPWKFQGGEAFLPDRFDESAIFSPLATPRQTHGRRGR